MALKDPFQPKLFRGSFPTVPALICVPFREFLVFLGFPFFSLGREWLISPGALKRSELLGFLAVF